MKLLEVLQAVKDPNLSLPQLESYRDQLANFKADIHIQISELKKKRAMFLLTSEEKTAAGKKMIWDGTPEGQRLIELVGYARAIPSVLESLRGRIYSHL